MDTFIKVSKTLIKRVGITAALLYGDLFAKQQYFAKQCKLGSDGFFFNSCDNIEADTGISRRQQCRLIKTLEDDGLLLVRRVKGVPNHFRVLVVTEDETARVPGTKRLSPYVTKCPDPQGTKGLANNNNINKNNERPTGVLTNKKNQDAEAVKTESRSELSASRQDKYKLDSLLYHFDWLLDCIQETKNPFLHDKLDTAGDASHLYNLIVACADSDRKQITYSGGCIPVAWVQDMYSRLQQQKQTKNYNG